MASDTTVILMVVGASGVNVAGTLMSGAADHGKDPLVPVIAMFVVGTFLLALNGAVPELAEAFAGAFLITSLLTNGKPVITAINNLTSPSTPSTSTSSTMTV